MPILSAVLITRDEEKNITECISGLKFCDEVIVVDGQSRDKTVEFAERLGAKVHSRVFTDFASQKNYGIGKAQGDWVLVVDADERVSSELADEIKKTVQDSRADGYYFQRRNRIFGRWMEYGAHENDFQLRLVRRNGALFEGPVHERIYLKGKVERLKKPLLHYSTDTISNYMRKLNVYTTLEAGILKEKSAPVSTREMRRRPLFVFLYRVFWKKGFLDGMEGFFFAVLSAYYEFVRRAKYWESAQGLK